MSKELDLELDTLWFVESPQSYLPPSLAIGGNRVCMAMHRQARNGSRKSKSITTAILWTDDATVSKFRLTWNPADPRGSVRAEQRHHPAPPRPSPARLAQAQRQYGRDIARWCIDRKGTQVGNGQCWTLAKEALQAVAERCKAQGVKPVMVSEGRLHGACIFQLTMPSPGTASGSLQVTGVAEGDILELKDAHFRHRPGHGLDRVGGDASITASKHTAVITAVHGNVLHVLEQNAPPNGKKVQSGSYRVDELVQGEIKIYRPMPDGWLPFNLDW